METLVVPLPNEMKKRLEALAAATGRGLEDCLQLAVAEFIDRWETHLDDLRVMGDEERRAVLCAASD